MKNLLRTICLFLFPAAVFSIEPRKTENIILFTTDGLRWQEVFGGADEALLNKKDGGVENLEETRARFWRDSAEERRETLLPFFWGVIARQGVVYGNQHRGSVGRVTNGLNFSYPGYQEMLAGFADPNITSNDKIPNPNPTVFEWLHEKTAYRGRVAVVCGWDVFPFIFNVERSGIPVNAGWSRIREDVLTERQQFLNQLISEAPRTWTDSRFDVFNFRVAMEHLRRHLPRVMYIGLDETDNWAHNGRYDRYLEAAQRWDAYVRELWETLQTIPHYQGKTSLVLTTDHGRGDAPKQWKHHGQDVKGAEFIWAAVLGPDTPARGEMSQTEEITTGQIAATIAALLGEDYNAAEPRAGKPLPDAIPAP